jgi:transposase
VSRPITIEQTPAGCAALRQRRLATGGAPATILVVLEATGSSWLALAQALAAHGFAVSVINPLQAHHCAKALLRGPTVVPSVQVRMEDLIDTLTAQFAAVEAALAAVADRDTAWAVAIRRLQRIPRGRAADGGVAGGAHPELHPVRHRRASGGIRRPRPTATRVGHQRARAPHDRARRQRVPAYHAVHGDPARRAATPDQQALLRSAPRGGQAEAGGAVCGRSQTAAPRLGGRHHAAALRPRLSTTTTCTCPCPSRLQGIP